MAGLEMWTIYDHPSDHPHDFVARRYRVTGEGVEADTGTLVADDLASLRSVMLGMGLFPMDRAEQDDPCIVETWL